MAVSQQYAIVEFGELDGSKSSAVVCSKWLIGRTQCYWPKVVQSKIMRLLKENVCLDEHWDIFDVRILSYSDNLQVAREKARKAEDTSNLSNSDSENRRRIEPERYILEERCQQKSSSRFQPEPTFTYNNLHGVTRTKNDIPPAIIPEASEESFHSSSPTRHSTPSRPSTSNKSNLTDISNVSEMVKRAGYKPFTLEGLYYLQALNFKKTMLLNERMKNTTQQSNQLSTTNDTVSFDNPVIQKEVDVTNILCLRECDSQNLINFLSTAGGDSLNSLTRRVMRRFLSNNIMHLYNRTGSDAKKKFIGNLEDIVIASVKKGCLKVDLTFNQNSVEKAIASTLKVAYNKDKGDQQRAKRKNDTAATTSKRIRVIEYDSDSNSN